MRFSCAQSKKAVQPCFLSHSKAESKHPALIGEFKHIESVVGQLPLRI